MRMVCRLCSAFLCFNFFRTRPWRMEIPGRAIKPAPQQPPKLRQWQGQILNPLCHERILILIFQQRRRGCFSTWGWFETPNEIILILNLNSFERECSLNTDSHSVALGKPLELMSVYSSCPLILQQLRQISRGCCWKHPAANYKKDPLSFRQKMPRTGSWGVASAKEQQMLRKHGGILYTGCFSLVVDAASEMQSTQLLGGKAATF